MAKAFALQIDKNINSRNKIFKFLKYFYFCYIISSNFLSKNKVKVMRRLFFERILRAINYFGENKILREEVEKLRKENVALKDEIKRLEDRINEYEGLKDLLKRYEDENYIAIKDKEELQRLLYKSIRDSKDIIRNIIPYKSQQNFMTKNPRYLIIYHYDLDGVASASLVFQHIKEKDRKCGVAIVYYPYFSISNLRDVYDRFYGCEEIFILDLHLDGEFVNDKGIKTTFISDKEPKSKPNEIEVIYDENLCTSEITYNYLSKKGFRGKNTKRIVDLGKMDHGIIHPDQEGEALKMCIDICPEISKDIVYELGINGEIINEKLWRKIDDFHTVSQNLKEYTKKASHLIYEDPNSVVIEFPLIGFNEGYILSDIRKTERKNAIGIKKLGDVVNISLKPKKNKKKIQKIKEYCENAGLKNYFHGFSGGIEVEKKQLIKVLEDLINILKENS